MTCPIIRLVLDIKDIALLEALECFLGGSIIISGSQAELRFNTDTAGVNGLVRLLYSYPLQEAPDRR